MFAVMEVISVFRDAIVSCFSAIWEPKSMVTTLGLFLLPLVLGIINPLGYMWVNSLQRADLLKMEQGCPAGGTASLGICHGNPFFNMPLHFRRLPYYALPTKHPSCFHHCIVYETADYSTDCIIENIR